MNKLQLNLTKKIVKNFFKKIFFLPFFPNKTFFRKSGILFFKKKITARVRASNYFLIQAWGYELVLLKDNTYLSSAKFRQFSDPPPSLFCKFSEFERSFWGQNLRKYFLFFLFYYLRKKCGKMKKYYFRIKNRLWRWNRVQTYNGLRRVV